MKNSSKMLRLIRLITSTAATLLLTTAAFGRNPNKLAAELRSGGSGSTVDVIVQFTSAPSQKHHDKIARRGGKLRTDLSGIIKAAHYQVPADQLESLTDDPEVLFVSPDRPVQGMLDFANPTVNANIARSNGWTGSGIGIAVIDSGITTTLPDISGRVVYSQSFIPGVTATTDQFGHGTHVAGILAGNATSSTGSAYTRSFFGMATKANLINLRVLDANGTGTDSQVINAINQAIALKSKYNIRVINLSLGRPVRESYKTDPLCQAVEAAWKAGIVVVVAAGNDGRNNSIGTNGYATIMSPANDPYVITVGAMNDKLSTSRADDVMTTYSSKGPTLLDHVVKPDIVAPGNQVVSLEVAGSRIATYSNVNKVPLNYYQNTTSTATSTTYYKLSGTSMAAPMVAGAAATMLQRDPSATPDTIKARLMKTATKTFPRYSTITTDGATYNLQYDVFTVGAGYLDLWAAVNSVDVAGGVGTAASPTAVRNPTTGALSLADTTQNAVWGDNIIWGGSAVWGDNIIWGDSAVWGDNIIWGDSAVWGDSTNSAFNIIWGNSAVWGDTTTTSSESLTTLVNGDH